MGKKKGRRKREEVKKEEERNTKKKRGTGGRAKKKKKIKEKVAWGESARGLRLEEEGKVGDERSGTSGEIKIVEIFLL